IGAGIAGRAGFACTVYTNRLDRIGTVVVGAAFLARTGAAQLVVTAGRCVRLALARADRALHVANMAGRTGGVAVARSASHDLPAVIGDGAAAASTGCIVGPGLASLWSFRWFAGAFVMAATMPSLAPAPPVVGFCRLGREETEQPAC